LSAAFPLSAHLESENYPRGRVKRPAKGFKPLFKSCTIFLTGHYCLIIINDIKKKSKKSPDKQPVFTGLLEFEIHFELSSLKRLLID